MYTEQELVGIAKRENNPKRSYLVVNRLQGKHVPVSPGKALAMFEELAGLVEKAYAGERLLLVGFAETATAIGAALAVHLNTYYMQTTREEIPGVEYLYFSESHSHATEQKLVKTDLDAVIENIDRIVFVEDEVTTGNTILNIVDIIEKTYDKKIHFSVASLLNGMNEAARETYAKRGIGTHYLVKTDHEPYTEIAENYRGDGSYHQCNILDQSVDSSLDKMVSIHKIRGACNGRRLNRGAAYGRACEHLWKQLAARGIIPVNKDENTDKKKILVLGTEECMYPALFVAKRLEEQGNTVRCHSTTRSPIAVSSEKDYPLHERYELASLYDKNRRTFIYDLDACDEVLIVTDADSEEREGLSSLIYAVRQKGNEKMTVVRWVEDRDDGGSFDTVSSERESSEMRSSYLPEDVTLLLKDITGQVQPQSTGERERLIQAGRHYCEMLPIEYVPSEKYMEAYQEALQHYASSTAEAVGRLADKVMAERGQDVVLVSLARAGIPIGILLKRYIQKKYRLQVPHYSISIIRGRGIDDNAMKYLLKRYRAEQLLFVDGWIGKGAILNELKKDLAAYPGVSPELAVAADPANVTKLCGTHEDILIPSSCLNSTVSGLVSRTFLREDIIGKEDFHGAVYYGELKDADLSYEFIHAIEREFAMEYEPKEERALSGQGIDEVRKIAWEYGIEDINLVKPGIGEATRVLLRRLPWKVLVHQEYKDDTALCHLIRLAEEKGVPVEYYPLEHYKACGIIKKLADA